MRLLASRPGDVQRATSDLKGPYRRCIGLAALHECRFLFVHSTSLSLPLSSSSMLWNRTAEYVCSWRSGRRSEISSRSSLNRLAEVAAGVGAWEMVKPPNRPHRTRRWKQWGTDLPLPTWGAVFPHVAPRHQGPRWRMDTRLPNVFVRSDNPALVGGVLTGSSLDSRLRAR